MIIPIYTNWQEETPSSFEGYAELIEEVENLDSFYLKEENIIIQKDVKQMSARDENRALKFKRLNGKFRRTKCKLTKAMHKELKKHRKDHVTDYERMKKVIKKYKDKHANSTKPIADIFKNFDDDYLIKFIQQNRKNWHPSIFSGKKYKVKFLTDKNGWESDFTTNRKIRILNVVNPSEKACNDELHKFTTYNGVPNSKEENYEKNRAKGRIVSYFKDDNIPF